jgi:hypothetical protein
MAMPVLELAELVNGRSGGYCRFPRSMLVFALCEWVIGGGVYAGSLWKKLGRCWRWLGTVVRVVIGDEVGEGVDAVERVGLVTAEWEGVVEGGFGFVEDAVEERHRAEFRVPIGSMSESVFSWLAVFDRC